VWADDSRALASDHPRHELSNDIRPGRFRPVRGRDRDRANLRPDYPNGRSSDAASGPNTSAPSSVTATMSSSRTPNSARVAVQEAPGVDQHEVAVAQRAALGRAVGERGVGPEQRQHPAVPNARGRQRGAHLVGELVLVHASVGRTARRRAEPPATATRAAPARAARPPVRRHGSSSCSPFAVERDAAAPGVGEQPALHTVGLVRRGWRMAVEVAEALAEAERTWRSNSAWLRSMRAEAVGNHQAARSPLVPALNRR